MNVACLPAFVEELLKIAGVAERASAKVEAHHSSEKPNWKAFQKSLQSKSFQAAVITHSKSDEKLKAYAKNVGDYLLSKEKMGESPSRSSGKKYSIRKLPDGRLGCGCNDWRYKRSVDGTDCAHIDYFRDVQKMKTEKVKKAHLVLDVNRTRLLSGEPLFALWIGN